jgi:hypothetical protein
MVTGPLGRGRSQPWAARAIRRASLENSWGPGFRNRILQKLGAMRGVILVYALLIGCYAVTSRN